MNTLVRTEEGSPKGEHDDYLMNEAQNTPPAERAPLTSAQARVDSVARTLDTAMNKASTLMLTPEEIALLKSDFPDDAFKPGAAGKEHLIYIEHAHLRDRFDAAIGMGQWALIRTRPHWAEEFTTTKGEKAARVYADVALLIRGCMASEAIGEMVYYPNNAAQNYGDAAEGAVTAAFRRCAKNFGVGLQAWKKDFGDGWWARKRGQAPRQTAPSAAPAPAGRAASPSPAQTPAAKVWTPADWLAWLKVQCALYPAAALAVLVEHGLIADTETHDNLALDKLTGWTGADVKQLAADVAAKGRADDQIPGAESDPDAQADGNPADYGDGSPGGQGSPASAPAAVNWKTAVLPFNSPKNPAAVKGMTLEALFANPATSKYAWGIAMNYKAEPYQDRDSGQMREPSPESVAFAAGCAAWRAEHSKK